MNALTKNVGVAALPRFIALCGNPKSGKSTTQKILQDRFGYQPVDDGAVIRRFAIDWLGFSHDDAYTQEGKAGYVEINGKTWQRRDILGTYGKHLEAMFGDYAMPMFGTRTLPEGGLYSFGSVRMNQGGFYKQQGGLVIEIDNPLAPPSPYAFDQFDKSLVDYKIENNALALGLSPEAALRDLETKVIQAIGALTHVDL